MNIRSSLLIIVVTAFAINTHAQIKDRTPFTPPTVQQQFAPNVQKVTISIDSSKTNGDILFQATINSTGRGMVHYQWILTPQRTTPNAPAPLVKKDSIMLNGSGMDKVYLTERKINNAMTTVKMQTLIPNVVLSNSEQY